MNRVSSLKMAAFEFTRVFGGRNGLAAKSCEANCDVCHRFPGEPSHKIGNYRT